MDTSKHQKLRTLTDEAYEIWKLHNCDRAQIFRHLTARQRLAFAATNFHYQVCNGGVLQWIENGYKCAPALRELRAACDAIEVIDHQAATIVRHILARCARWSDRTRHSSADDQLDTLYYTLDDRFLTALEAAL